MKASLNVPRSEEESGEVKELEADDAEVKMSRKANVKWTCLQERRGAESSEDEPQNHAMARFLFDFVSLNSVHQARLEASAKAEEAGPAEKGP